MKTWHIHINGQVQGVGFRPYVYRLARQMGLKGWVHNTFDGLHICINADGQDAEHFLAQLVSEKPPLAIISNYQISETEPTFFDNFQIIHSEATGMPKLLLTPDVSLCADCRNDILHPKDRRYHYAFTTCTNCGPRYSITAALPYDRPMTSMQPFQMCPECLHEYHNPEDRRYYSQTNSCPKCGIQIQLLNSKFERIASESEAIHQVVNAWQNGEIVAIKGIGGYLLTCDANNRTAIENLRLRKHRPTKPLALMFPDLAGVQQILQTTAAEQKALTSKEAPIVLLSQKKQCPLPTDLLAPGMDRLGVMLPYTPLYVLLLQQFGKPIVATSANISQSPIVFEESQAADALPTLADWILTNNRAILTPQDDSVVAFSPNHQQPILMRRSRGYAPGCLLPFMDWPSESCLGMGASMKSTFSLLHQKNCYLSQYFGSLEHFDTQLSFQKGLDHLIHLLQFQPEVILTDLHPDYASTQLGIEKATALGLPLRQIQHHEAHFGAIMGESNLLESTEPVLGIIWDGTGLGTDKQIWGGEYFQYQKGTINRIAHWAYFDFILGNKMPKEPRISAFSLAGHLAVAKSVLEPKFSTAEWKIYQQKRKQTAPLQTSSIGRLFDGVASLLGIADRQSYEGEAAMQLEQLARRFLQLTNGAFSESYQLRLQPTSETSNNLLQINTSFLITQILNDLLEEVDKGRIAARFHLSLVESIRLIANDLKIKKLAFSGGVFQNALLVDLIIDHLHQDYELHFHEKLSPNDENIAFGQLVRHYINKKQAKNNHYVSGNTGKN